MAERIEAATSPEWHRRIKKRPPEPAGVFYEPDASRRLRGDGLASDALDVATADADITEFAVAHLREFATRFTNATPCAELLGDSSERRHDRQPIAKTIQIRSSSLVNGMYLKGAGSSSSGVLSDGASLSFL